MSHSGVTNDAIVAKMVWFDKICHLITSEIQSLVIIYKTWVLNGSESRPLMIFNWNGYRNLSVLERSCEPQITKIFVSMLYDKKWSGYGNFKIWLNLLTDDVINDVISVWHITGTTTHPQLFTCKILFLWHQCTSNYVNNYWALSIILL